MAVNLTPYYPVIYFGVILLVTWLVGYLVGLVVAGLMRRSNPQATATARRLAVVIVWFVGIVFAIQELGFGVNALLLVLALLGLAAIVALRQPLENFGAKYFAELYTPFKIGDTIRVGEHAGKVIEVNAMSTVLLSEDDHLIALPNSVFLRSSVINLTPQAWKELIVPISLSGGVDLASFESEMMKSLGHLRLRLDRRYPPVFTLKSRSAQSTELVLTVMVRRPEDRDPVLAEVNTRLTEAIERTRSTPARSAPAGEAAGSHP
jgi:small conductance mechanosensitive channel